MIKNIAGYKKYIFNIKLKLNVFFHFLPEILKEKITLRRYIVFLRRLLFFLSRLQHNKFVKIGKNTRLGLYIPGMPSKPFYTACKKFMTFDEKLPCTTVLISITSACHYKCEHCYQKNDLGKDIEIEKLTAAVGKLQNMGVSFFNIEGGEPFLVYDKLKTICGAIDDRSEIWINSTGDGMTIERLKELKKLNVTAVMFSMHSPYPKEFNNFTKSENAWHTLVKGVRLCHEAGIAVAFNTCLGRDSFYNGNFEKIMEKAKDFNAAIIQLIKPKAAGGWLESGVEDFSEEDLNRVKKLVNRYNSDKRYEDYPSISAQIIEEDKKLFGCTAGGTDRFYINAKGDVQPCEFLNISFGNIGRESFYTIYRKMRRYFEKPGECWLCEKYSKDILRIFKENNLKSLPLDEHLSKEIYEHWDRGAPTGLYERIENGLRKG
jgi:MoaA/NifB/PqqE/SkfB family radical SAM enzyme